MLFFEIFSCGGHTLCMAFLPLFFIQSQALQSANTMRLAGFSTVAIYQGSVREAGGSSVISAWSIKSSREKG